ncbi:SDR family NAD(P)-dependent oxidoreductase [Bacillus bombysepticus]|uniref:SDR family oxidoreductase n=2 Tax=Bacillus cereus group TaxID=86661 RepID=A0AAW4QRR3_BACCE|nr:MULTISPECIES: SDR family oxidoreductase [Bacillus cereus group]MBY0037320.1 SDR family oxidoreductase [Bacillus cereus]MEC2871004.1 SDR family NAD(P)-dependent oxidoreductase [Bacillus cereus]OTZ69760.1 oxidoreductase [Bacillus thuringiensis serovar kumamtoensis]
MEKNRKVAIVTGGASGIGRAICNELTSQNVFVIIGDINEQQGKAFEAKLNQDVLTSRFVYLNVTDYNCVKHVIKEIHEEFGRLDYLFNNAGISMYGELYDMSIENWKEIVDINLWGVINGTQIGYKIMKEQGFGHIVNTASAAGLGPSPVASAYSATKHAIVGLTTSLHYEAEEFGVKVSALCPAFVDTPIFDAAKAINIDKSAMTKQMKKHKMMSPQKLAKVAINGVRKNKPIICPMPLRKTMDIIFTIFPSLQNALARFVCKVVREAKGSSG